MKYHGLNEIREIFLKYFESKEHLRLPSFPLIPQNEKSLLLINSGMAPMKSWFSGEQTPPSPRVTTCQKCIRTPDIERVGKTSRHATYFEMLGNFSFGDYFKREACAWAWEFCTDIMDLPTDKLHVSIYVEDDETYDIWRHEIGIPDSHITRLGRADNFWEIGAGPCGPSSEIYFDRGEKHGCGSENCRVGCDCDRFVEFWNLVFTQFNNDGAGNYTPLKNKNIDTGMGLERLACIMQDVSNLFEVDTVKSVMAKIAAIAKIKYGDNEKHDVSLRVITDHIRSTVVLIGDGVLPSNEGRGYVLRRLLRRAARHGRLLHIEKPFLEEPAKIVIAQNKDIYPELAMRSEYILRTIKAEEERFSKTIGAGLGRLTEMIEGLKQNGSDVLSGGDAFMLYDTFGFPIDLTMEILEEQGLTLDHAGFEASMEEQRSRARAAHTAAGDFGWSATSLNGQEAPTVFVGYDKDEAEGTIEHIIVQGEQRGAVSANENAILVLDISPFYAESGGQVGDRGIISSKDGVFVVNDTKKTPDDKFLHIGSVVSGSFATDDRVVSKIDISRRNAIRRAHSATHLLQGALREVLGSTVEQAGSYVEPDMLRFDFTHHQAMTSEELVRVEMRVNELILADLPVITEVMELAKAQKAGAIALFGEKYDENVRVVEMSGFSKELCGGTHLQNTARSGLFKIKSEGSIAAGIRRIEAITGLGVLELIANEQKELSILASTLKTSPTELPRRAEQVMAELKTSRAEVEKLALSSAKAAFMSAFENAKNIEGVKLAIVRLKDISLELVRMLGDDLRSRDDALTVLFALEDDNPKFATFSTKAAVKAGLHAGKLVKEVAMVTGGNGGGKPDSASAGGRDLSKLDEALAFAPVAAEKIIAQKGEKQ